MYNRKNKNMKTKMKSLTVYMGIFISLFAGNNSIAQTTTVGTDFWMGFTYAFEPLETTTEYKLWISSVSGASGTVSVPLGAYSVPFTVAANSTTIVTIPYAKVQNESSETIQPKGVHVISNSPVNVSGSMYLNVRTEATLVMPTNVLGTEYYVLSYPGYWYGQSHFEVVATQDNTVIQITPTSETMGSKPAGTMFSITLDSGEVYMVRAEKENTFPANKSDLTGTRIVGTDPCKPFAVFGGTAEADVPTSCSYADPLYEQLQPVNTWGKEYIIPPFFSHNGSQVRIVASQANTSVVIDGGTPITLNAGQFNEQNFNGSAHCITADKPIQVAQFMKGDNCNGGSSGKKGDPSMIVLSSTDQVMKSVTFRGFMVTFLQTNYVNVTMKTSHTGQLKLNGTTVASGAWTAVPSCAGYSYAALPVANNVTHTLAADSGFVGSIYGYGSGADSYAHSLGYSINPIITGTTSTGITYTGNASICSGQNITLTVSGGGGTNYVWLPGGQTTSSITVAPLVNTTYTVNIKNGLGCTNSISSATFAITVSSCGFNVVPTSVSMCREECRDISATSTGGTPAYTYSWTPGGATGSTISVCPLVSTTYTVSATDAAGATATAISTVTIIPTPDAKFTMTPSGVISPNTLVSFTDNSTGGSSLSWNFGDPLSAENTSVLPSPTHIYSIDGDYCTTLTVTNSTCADTETKCVEVINEAVIIYPNVFTPNNDDNNDWFYFETKGIKELTCTVYDRWGLKMSDWVGVSEGWDGRTTSGLEAPDGVYYYIMTATPSNEKAEIIKKQGFVQLLKRDK